MLVSRCSVIKRGKAVGGGGHDDPPRARARAVGLLVVTIASEPLKPSFAQPSQKLPALLWPSAAWKMLAISEKGCVVREGKIPHRNGSIYQIDENSWLIGKRIFLTRGPAPGSVWTRKPSSTTHVSRIVGVWKELVGWGVMVLCRWRVYLSENYLTLPASRSDLRDGT